MSTATTAPTADEVAVRSLANLERASAELRAIDLRSLKGAARAEVKVARQAVLDATMALRAAK